MGADRALTIHHVAAQPRGFEFVLMTNAGPIERIDDVATVERRFPMGSPVGFLAHTAAAGWISVEA
jgi:hypothetical protein